VIAGTCWDVVIAGAGPAGAVTALVLARAGHHVLLADCSSTARRIGEALPPAARPLLRDLGVLPILSGDAHLTCVGNASAWGSDALQPSDFIFNVHGMGVHLDRSKFDQSLRSAAAAAGATLVTGRLEWRGGAKLRIGGHEAPVKYRWLVDASGRSAALSRALGARRQVQDQLLAFHAQLDPAPGTVDTDNRAVIESGPKGWWYTALLPSRCRLVVFFTDRDLFPVPSQLSPKAFMNGIRSTTHVREIVDQSRYGAPASAHGADAASSRLDAFAGDGWVAVGDAALAFDPLSSQGLYNALYSGMRAGEALCAALAGDPGAIGRYAMRLEEIYAAYRRNLLWFYNLEARWPSEAFWARRHRWARAG
jgi:flavin-dependent dehydrogenase